VNKGKMKKTRVAECADNSVNICTGCAHGCLYCYAAFRAARFKRCPRHQWTDEHVRPEAVKGLAGRLFQGRVMFPTAHDWTDLTRPHCQQALAHMLAAGNDVLVVSKARSQIASDVHAVWKACPRPNAIRPELRMSITCVDEALRKFWEPNAAPISERVAALRLAKGLGLPTSASLEPLLEPSKAVELVTWLEDYCVADEHGRGGEIWIGKANNLPARTAWAKGVVPDIEGAVAALEAVQTDDAVMAVWVELHGNPKVRWKDSYADAINRHIGQADAGTRGQGDAEK
jgi:protein gp37